MKNEGIGRLLRYWFDNTLARGPTALLVWLGLAISIVIIAISVLVWVTGIAAEDSLTEQAWVYLMTMFGVIDADISGHWSFRFASLIVILSGIFVMSAFIGILTTGIDNKLNELRKGRSQVIESGHVVILGWTEEVFTLIGELLEANSNKPNACIAILANREKVEMEARIRETIDPNTTTRIVCRSGSPMVMQDLEIVSLNTASSIIILTPPDDTSGMATMKTILAITKNPNRRPEPYHLVTSINDPKIVGSSRLLAGDELEIVLGNDLISRIAAQTSLQSGLSIVYTDLLDFAGDEIYFETEARLAGKTYRDAVLSYDTSAVFGILTEEGIPFLNPPPDTVLGKQDQVIAISRDDDTIILSSQTQPPIDEQTICSTDPESSVSKRILVLGWNPNSLVFLRHLFNYIPAGSTIIIGADAEGLLTQIDELIFSRELTIDHRKIEPTDRQQLDKLPFDSIHHVVILPSHESAPTGDRAVIDQIDAGTFVTLFNVRDIREKGDYALTIVSEILDLENRSLIEASEADDFVVSDQLISLTLSQIAGNKVLGTVFNRLFESEGAEIYLKPAVNYINTDQAVNFFTIAESALRRNETAIGYRIDSQRTTPNCTHNNKDMNYGLVLNPDKTIAVSFSTEDKIIVLAETGNS